MSEPRPWMWIAAAAVLVVGVLAFEDVRMRRAVATLRDALAEARVREPEDPAPGADGPKARPAARPRGLLATDAHLRKLRADGLADPLADLRRDLQAHPELIPAEGTLGGRMGFYSPDDIVLLNDRWVYAYFEDGHRAGSMLLEFEVGPGGAILWRPLASALW